MDDTNRMETAPVIEPFRRRLLMTLPAAAAFPSVLFGGDALAAATREVAQLPRKERALVQAAGDYLEGLTKAKATFFQTNDRGGAADGVLYLNRPGKARFEYKPSAGLLIVADGKKVSVYDSKLKTFDSYNLATTPLSLLLSRHVSLDNAEVMVTRVNYADGGFSLTLQDAARQADGKLILDFKDDPIALTGWTVIDQQNRRTNVKLGPLQTVASLDPALFVLNDPGKGRR